MKQISVSSILDRLENINYLSIAIHDITLRMDTDTRDKDLFNALDWTRYELSNKVLTDLKVLLEDLRVSGSLEITNE